MNSTVQILAFLFLPGTIIHELAHAITAGVTLVPVGNIEFTPQIREDGVKLGSAEIGESDPFRRALIGVAPVLIGTAILIFSMWFYLQKVLVNPGLPVFETILLLYILFEVSNTMFSSPKDLEGFLEVFALIAAIFGALFLLKFYSVFIFINNFLLTQVLFLEKIALFLLLPLIVDSAIYFFSKLLLPKQY